jgi:hypothetical protein
VAAVAVALLGPLLTGRPSSGVGWPAGVAPIAAFVSHDRGLAFTRNVPVHFESDATFDRQLVAEDTSQSPSERASNLRYQEELEALGLLDGSVNLARAQTSEDTDDVEGYYDPETKSLFVRGRQLDPQVQVTIAHELTHALQDQHFGLTRLGNEERTDGETAAITALEEGDAVLNEDDYLSSLPPVEQRQEAAEEGAGGGGATPGILDVIAQAPYVLGPDMVEAIYALSGNEGINAAFRHPPTTELDELDATAFVRHLGSVTLRPPPLLAGERRDGPSDDFGAFVLYMTLASRIDARSALGAADGWGGGELVQYKTGGTSCLRIDVVGRSSAQTAAIALAAGHWATLMAPGQASASALGSEVRIDACDPGPSAKAGPHSLDDAMNLADERNQNAISALYDGAAPVVAACVGDSSLSDSALVSAENAENPTAAEPSVRVHALLQRLVSTCAGKHR